MAWESVTWACGHEGEMQLYGKQCGRDSRVAYEASRKCLACWLVAQWVEKGDARAARPDRFDLAKDIAGGKNIRITGGEANLGLPTPPPDLQMVMDATGESDY
jgi:hypothetical protein